MRILQKSYCKQQITFYQLGPVSQGRVCDQATRCGHVRPSWTQPPYDIQSTLAITDDQNLVVLSVIARVPVYEILHERENFFQCLGIVPPRTFYLDSIKPEHRP